MTASKEAEIALIDMDGVLANFEKGFLDIWRKKFPDEFFIPLDKRRTFQIEDLYPAHLREKIWDIFLAKNFFLDLEPIQGGIEAIKEISKKYEVFICTAPLFGAKYCIPEKYEWIEAQLGKEYAKRMILAKDKTLIRGKFLIDDKPEIRGLRAPEWEQLLFDQPYNRTVASRRRIHWSDPSWKKILGIEAQ